MRTVAVIGAGASGLAAVSELIKYPESFYIQLFEKNAKIGKKIAATGNGHCNLSNTDMKLSAYQGDIAPLYDCVASFDIEQFAEEIGFLTRCKGNLYYPYSEQARTVTQAFEKLLSNHQVTTFLNTEIVSIKKDSEGYFLYDDKNRTFHTDILIIAGGGKASPQLASDGSCLKLLEKMGIELTILKPSLVQMKTSPVLKRLKGCRVHGTFSLLEDGSVKDEKKGEALITDDGISGIAIMQLSRHLNFEENHNYILCCNLIDEIDTNDLRGYYEVHRMDENPYLGIIQEKLAVYFNEQKTVSFNDFKERLGSFKLKVTGTRGFESAQVMRGGVPASALSQKLMLKKYPDIYVCGEILNVDGDCGGYNLHFAFATGRLAANLIVKKNVE